MKTIPKFKAWHTTRKMMFDVQCMIWNEDRSKIKSIFDMAGAEYDATYVELLQYTGFIDKNGVEIYTGYLLKNGGDNEPGIVLWKDDRGMFQVGDAFCELFKYSGEEKEVVGDIYQGEYPKATDGEVVE